ncbi:MAG: hypothetical protein M9962_05805 [Oligoflexia bacterium]|nr:hypothetical protein [Oligoflexia bacterium]
MRLRIVHIVLFAWCIADFAMIEVARSSWSDKLANEDEINAGFNFPDADLGELKKANGDNVKTKTPVTLSVTDPTLQGAGLTTTGALDPKKKQIKEATEGIEYAAGVNEKTKKGIGKAIQERDPNGQSKLSPGDQARAELFLEIPDKKKPTKPVRDNIVSKVEDEKLRKQMELQILAIRAEEEQRRNKTKYLADLAQLSQMAATAFQRASDMQSLPQSAVQGLNTNGEQKKLADSSGFSKEKNEGDISDKEIRETTSLESQDSEKLSDEDKKKFKTALEEAQRQKNLMAIRKSLRSKLKDAMAKDKTTHADDPATAFQRELLDDYAERSLASLDPEKTKAEFENSPVFSAMQEAQFGMSYPETEAEVKQMLNDLDSELGLSSAIKSGILGINSKSLFERIREVHKHCMQSGCVKF